MKPDKKLQANNRAAVVDEIGRLEEKLAPHQPDLKRLEALRKLPREWTKADGVAAEASVTYAGDQFVAILGPRGLETKIKLAAAFKKLGKAAFLKACSMTLTALRGCEGVSEATFADLTVSEQTGSRSLNVARVESA